MENCRTIGIRKIPNLGALGFEFLSGGEFESTRTEEVAAVDSKRALHSMKRPLGWHP